MGRSIAAAAAAAAEISAFIRLAEALLCAADRLVCVAHDDDDDDETQSMRPRDFIAFGCFLDHNDREEHAGDSICSRSGGGEDATENQTQGKQ